MSARDQLPARSALTSGAAVPMPSSACFRPSSDQPLTRSWLNLSLEDAGRDVEQIFRRVDAEFGLRRLGGFHDARG